MMELKGIIRTHLKIIFPGHVLVDMSFGTVGICCLSLERRCRVILIVSKRPLPFFHLNKIR